MAAALAGLCWTAGQAAGAAGGGDEPSIQTIRNRMAASLGRLPDYTCQMKVMRFERLSKGRAWLAVDTIDLSLTVIKGQETYGTGGNRKMEITDLRALVPDGSIGEGSFAGIAQGVFGREGPEFEYRGTKKWKGRKAYRFDYRVSQAASGYEVVEGGFTARVAYEGTFLADEASGDVLRLEMQAVGMPVELGIAKLTNVIEYQKVALDGSNFRLPSEAEMEVSGANGAQTLNRMKFYGCQEFRGEARMVNEGEKQ